jgi:hypothetical protein
MIGGDLPSGPHARERESHRHVMRERLLEQAPATLRAMQALLRSADVGTRGGLRCRHHLQAAAER